MGRYKITNITNLLGKRDNGYNSTLDVEYVDGMMKKTVKIKPGGTLYLTIPSLPLSVHRLRVKSLVSVSEVSGEEIGKLTNSLNKKSVVKTEVKTTTTTTTKEKTTRKKTGGRKKKADVEETTTTTKPPITEYSETNPFDTED